ncbi:hypothetical protein SDC9_118514 [bioreactor metagenome]|uniref:Uncharacterized protein n=1 Tax=bioreactor metagenome TaxID=1076179 RepID=A0A645C2G4_9ZZZZ
MFESEIVLDVLLPAADAAARFSLRCIISDTGVLATVQAVSAGAIRHYNNLTER